jgi:hypothetical protein
MARVFQAYQCQYAMHFDMNALEHTYASVVTQTAKQTDVEYLVSGMSVLDKKYEGQILPRFLGYSDNRDFFFLYPARQERAVH